MTNNQKIIFYVGLANHQVKYANLLSEGMRRHGYNNIQIKSPGAFSEADNPDLAIFWAHKKQNIINYQNARKKNYLVMERAYLHNRHSWCSLGYNGLNGRADFNNSHITSSKRWNTHFSGLMKPWKTDGDYVLVCGQVSTDASVRHLDVNKWYRKTISHFNKQNIPVVFRLHPLEKNIPNLNGLIYTMDTNSNIEDTFKKTLACVTISSNSGVLSVMEGIPTVATDIGSMAYAVTSHELDDINYKIDRQDWANKLAYCQWTPDEMANGLAWEHLKGKINENI